MPYLEKPYCKPGDKLPFTMEETSCDLCGSELKTPLYVKPDQLFPQYYFRVVQCIVCSLAYVDPRPTLESLDFFYPPAFFELVKENTKSFPKRLSYLPRGCSGRLLDVGCAQGLFPLYLKRKGWDAEGWETICPTAAPGVTVHTGPIQQLAQSENRYDVITSWAFFEHLTNPSVYFDAVSRMLKPGGRFIFLVTNIESPASRYFMGEDVPRHLHFFSPGTLKAFTAKYGMVLEKIHHKNDVFPSSYHFCLPWAGSKLVGRELDLAEARYPSWQTGPLWMRTANWSYMVLDKAVGRGVRLFFELIHRNGIITAEARKL
jgi:SAM-dependent methyltransferase